MTSDIDYAAVVPAPVGLVGVVMGAGQLLAIDLDPPVSAVDRAPDGAVREVLDQLFHYFEDATWRFDLPLAIQGTPFQRRVWQALSRIPSGLTRSYGELAVTVGSSARAVGGACRRNPVPIVVPCHRVVAADGGTGGFMGRRDGKALTIKTWLLDHERGRL